MRALAQRLAALLMRYATHGRWVLTASFTCAECGAQESAQLDLLAAVRAGVPEERPCSTLH
jgi:hypothetical protein